MKFDPAETLRLGQFLLGQQTLIGPIRATTWDKDAWDDYQAAARLLKEMHERIAELEAARIAYASEFPPNADGDPDVGNIHANIRKLKAKLATPSPHDPGQAAIATLQGMGYEHRGGVLWAPPVGKVPEWIASEPPATPWYPDDSGEWVEVPEDLMEMPPDLLPETRIVVLLKYERTKRLFPALVARAKNWRWAISPGLDARIVAYKVVKP